MASTVSNRLNVAEVKTSHREHDARIEAVKNLHPAMRMAKAKVGAAFEQAIGDEAHKAYGHEGLISGVCSGEKVPDYMARIYQDPAARRRFALALLKDDATVRVRTVVEIEDEKASGQ